MSDVREELKLHIEWGEAALRFVEAKEKRGTDEFDQAEYEAAKAKVSAMRAEWRGIRDYLRAVAAEEYAALLEQHGVVEANPEPHGVSAAVQES